MRRPVELSSLYDDLRAAGREPRTEVLSFAVEQPSAAVADALGLASGAEVYAIERLRLTGNEPLVIMHNHVPVALVALDAESLRSRGLYDLLRSAGMALKIAAQTIGGRAARPAEARLLNEKAGATVADHVPHYLRRHRPGRRVRVASLSCVPIHIRADTDDGVTTALVTHWIDGEPFAESGVRTGDVYDPATGGGSAEVAFAAPGDVDAAVAAGRAGVRRVARRRRSPSASRCSSGSASWSPHAATSSPRIITAEHGKALGDARGEVARGLEVVEFACGVPHLLKGAFSESVSTGVDVVLGAPAARRRRRHQPVQLPGDGAVWFFPIAIASGNTVVLKPQREGSVGRDLVAELWADAGLPAGVFNVVHGDKVAVDRLLEAPGREGGVVRRLHADRALRLRDGHRARQARAGARRREEPHGRAARRRPRPRRRRRRQRRLRVGGRALHGHLGGRRGRRRRRRAGRTHRASASRQLRRRRRTRGARDMGPLVTAAAPRQGRVATSTPAWPPARAGRRRARASSAEGATDGFWLGPTLFDHVTPDMALYTDEIFGPVLSVVRVADYDAALELVNANPYGNGTAIFTNDGGAARRFQNEVEVGHGRHQRADPRARRLLLLRRLEELALRRHPRPRHRRRPLLHPGQGGHSRWLDPCHGGVDLGFPTQT